jgi:phage baseplate assembly protein W
MRIEIVPESERAEIDQNVRVICATMRGTQPLDRLLGIDPEILDMPGSRGQALLSAELVDALPAQEPRVRVTGVRFEGDPASGAYEPVISYEAVGL